MSADKHNKGTGRVLEFHPREKGRPRLKSVEPKKTVTSASLTELREMLDRKLGAIRQYRNPHDIFSAVRIFEMWANRAYVVSKSQDEIAQRARTLEQYLKPLADAGELRLLVAYARLLTNAHASAVLRPSLNARDVETMITRAETLMEEAGQRDDVVTKTIELLRHRLAKSAEVPDELSP